MQSETFPAAQEGGIPRSFMDLAIDERAKLLKDRLKKYCQKARSGRSAVSLLQLRSICEATTVAQPGSTVQ